MLSRFRKSKDRIHHNDAVVRRQAVDSLTAQRAQELVDELAALAANDPNGEVRAACITKITQPQALAPLLDTADAPLAALRLAELLAATPTSNALLAHPRVLPLALPHLPTDVALPLIAQVDDEALLIELCMGVRGDVRDAMLARITSGKSLGALERHSRNHNKFANRYARSGLERIRQARQAGKALVTRLTELVDALERSDAGLPQRQHALHRDLKTTRNDLNVHREILDAAAEPLENTTLLEERIALLPPPPALQAKDESSADPAAPQPPGPDPFVGLVVQFAALHQTMTTQNPELTQVKSQRQSLTQSWLRAADQQQPTQEQHQTFESVSHAYQQYVQGAERTEACVLPDFSPLPETLPLDAEAMRELWRTARSRRKAQRRLLAELEKINWPGWARQSTRYQALQQCAAQLQRELERLGEHEAGAKQELAALVLALEAEIDAGAINKASNTLSSARRLSRALPPTALEDLLAALNLQAAKFSELRDWQTYATSPKRQELCEKIKEIAASPLLAKDQADRIKQLRSDWNQLGPVSKHEDRKLADEFNRLAEAAFEPCRAYFAEQAEIRKANLEQRRALCDQLRNYLESTHWASADIKAAEQILRTARTEWRRFHPVDRNPGKHLETAFEALQDQLHQHIKDAWHANLEEKQAIVREAESLVDGDAAVSEKIDKAKALQQRWQQVGTTPRKPDQQLWQEFRRACDAIFTQRDAAREQAGQSLQQALQNAADLLAELRASVDETTPATSEPDFVRSARGRFAQLPELPERAFRDAQRDFDELMGQYKTLLGRRAATARLDQLRQLQAWDSSTTEFERAHAL